MAKQRAVLLKKIDQDNFIGNLELGEVPKPEPGEGAALLHIILRPVNPADILSTRGMYDGFKPRSLPAVPGIEGVAEIVSSAGKFKVGQRVVARSWPNSTGNGTWQEFYVISEDLLEAVPDNVSNEQAAGFWVNPVTALGMIRTLDIPKGEWMIQSAAGSAIGRQLIQIAKEYGIKTINVVRRSAQKQELLDLGADVVIATDREDVKSVVEQATDGKGAWGGVDPVAGETTRQLFSALRPLGKLLVYGVLSGLTSSVDVPDLLFERKQLTGFWLGPWFKSHDEAGRQEIVQEIFRLLGNNIITEYKGKTYPLDRVKEAVEESLKPARGGKVFLSN